MTPSKAPDTEKVPIERIDSATRAPEPLEKDVATRDAMARAAGANPGLPFLPPGDVPGWVADPNFPTPPPFFNTYSFTVFFKADPSAVPYLGQVANPLGDNIRVVAPTIQAAIEAIMAATFPRQLFKVIGPCASFVGADASLSTVAEAEPVSAGTQHPKPLGEHSKSSSQSTTTPRKSHSSWD